MWMHLLAIPLGAVILTVIILIAGLIVNYTKEVFGVIILLIVLYWLGANALGIYH